MDNLILTASRVRCRILDDEAIVMVKQTYKNSTTSDVGGVFSLPAFPAGKLISVSVFEGSGDAVLKTETRDNTDQPAATTTVHSPAFSLPRPVHPNETISIQLEYLVRLTNDAEMQWTLTLPEGIVPMESERPQPVPDWDMPKVRNPESLYHREQTGSNVVGAAFSALPKCKPKQGNSSDGDDDETSEVKWSDVSGSGDDQTEDTQQPDIPHLPAESSNLELFIEAYVSKGVAKLTATGKPVRKNVSGVSAQLFLNKDGLDRYGPFRCTVHEATRSLQKPVVWSSEGLPCAVKVAWDPSLHETKQMDENGDLEIVCLVDCTDAMNGSKIINVRRALKLMLNSLPSACSFNIYGFGRKWVRLLDQLRPYRSGFINSRGLIKKMRAGLGTPKNGCLPVLEKALESVNFQKGKGRILLISAAQSATSTSVQTKQWTEQGIPIYSVVLKDNPRFDDTFTDIEQVTRATGGCCEYVTEPDLLDQALLRQLRRCCYSGGKPWGDDIFVTGTSTAATTVDPRNATAFIAQDVELKLGEKVDVAAPFDVSHPVPINLIPNAQGASAHLLQVVANNNATRPDTKTMTLMASDGTCCHLPRFFSDEQGYSLTRAALPVNSKWQRPWQMALDESNSTTTENEDGGLSSSGSDTDTDTDTDSDSSSDQSWEATLPKRRISLAENFDLVSQRFVQAVESDGQVSWRFASNMLQLPKRPYKWANQDLWATVVMMTYLQLNDRTDDPCWDMYLEKCWDWVRTKGCQDEGHRRWLFKRAIAALDNTK